MKNKKYKIIALISVLLISVLVAIVRPYRISGDCMEPAIMDGKRYFLNKIPPSLRHYQIGDIIVFEHEGKSWISRIIARENDTVQITEGKIILNGVTFTEGNIHRNWTNWKCGVHAIDEPLQVPGGHVFVLSDNLSAQHDDSRVFGPIPTSSILGVVW